MVDLSISVVNWNGRGVIEHCLESILKARRSLSLEIFGVDNASSDESQALIRGRFPELTLIENQENRGYAAANNQALERAQGRYCLILNNDTVTQKGALETMVGFMDTHTNVGIVGGRLLNLDGSFQPSMNRRFPNLLDLFLDEMFLFSVVYYRLIKTRFGSRLISHFRDSDAPKEAAWIGGACMLVRREVLKTVGGIDDRFFFYREDCDWCLRTRKAGWKVVYLPTAVFVHAWGHSSQLNTEKISFESRRSVLYFFKKHQGRVGFYAAKAILIAGLVIRCGFLFFGTRIGFEKLRKQHRTFQKMISYVWSLKDPSQPLTC